jgi:ubiquitin
VIQPFLFDVAESLVVPPSARMRCANNQTGEGWLGPHHCAECAAEVERQCAQFAADVAAGKYDADGYTPADRRAQQRQKAKTAERTEIGA